jgi:hypothetical protein
MKPGSALKNHPALLWEAKIHMQMQLGVKARDVEATGTFIHHWQKCKEVQLTRCQRCTPKILGTHEAEIRRIVVQSQPEQIEFMRLCLKMYTSKIVWQSGTNGRAPA